MAQNTTLKLWMEQQGYTARTLAEELDLSYEYIFKIAANDRKMSTNFRIKFVARFGWDEAAKLFDTSLLRSLSTEAAPV